MKEFETFSAEERAYLDSNGEKPLGDDVADTEEEDTAEIDNEADDESAEVDAKDEADAEDEEAKEEEKPKRKDQRIPLRKLLEKEELLKQAERERDAIKEQFARADERLRLLFSTQQQEQTKEPPPPDKNQDPLGYMDWQQGRIDALARVQQQQLEEFQRQSQINAVDAAYKQSWGAFASKTPDALDAYQHFVNVTAGYLEMQGVAPAQINAMVENEERKITFAAMQRGVSPAELIYEKAKSFGYQPKPSKQQSEDATKKAEADIERRQRGQVAGKSLSNTGGSRGAQAITAAELANMSDDEFEEVRSKIGDRAFRKLMGE